MHLPGRPVANFDPEGLIFAAGISSDTIKLYDLRSFEKVNFICFIPKLLYQKYLGQVFFVPGTVF